MKRFRLPAAVLFAALLGGGPALASAASCCPRPDAPSPDLAAAGCCGGCPSALVPAPETASWTHQRSGRASDQAALSAGLAPDVLRLERFPSIRVAPARILRLSGPPSVPLRL